MAYDDDAGTNSLSMRYREGSLLQRENIKNLAPRRDRHQVEKEKKIRTRARKRVRSKFTAAFQNIRYEHKMWKNHLRSFEGRPTAALISYLQTKQRFLCQHRIESSRERERERGEGEKERKLEKRGTVR